MLPTPSSHTASAMRCFSSGVRGQAQIIVRRKIDARGRAQLSPQTRAVDLVQTRSNPPLERQSPALDRGLRRTSTACRACSNKRRSASASGLGVVSSRSPRNTEFAPASKHNACASSDSDSRPALNRTIDLGIRMRAVRDHAHQLEGIFRQACSPSGVPSTRTSIFTGTLSGCGLSVDNSLQQPVARAAVFAHADDAAAAYRDPRRGVPAPAYPADPGTCAW